MVPSTNPVAGFPARAATVTGDSRPHYVSIKHSGAAHAAATTTAGGLVLESTAFEAGGAAGEVVGPAAPDGAVPITWTNVGAGGESKSRHSPAAETTEV